MFLIWAGPDGEDVCENLQLSLPQQHNLDAGFEAFKRYCEPICNFCAARFKFRTVKQHETETINAFYHCILHLARQYQFENINEHLIDAIVYGCKSKKVQDKQLQMSIQMTLEECLLICRHYESLQWHINTARPTGSEIKLWMVLQGDAQDQNPEVLITQEGLSNLYVQTNLGLNVLHVALYTKPGSVLHHLLFVSNATNLAIFQGPVATIETTEAVDPSMLHVKLRHLILQNL